MKENGSVPRVDAIIAGNTSLGIEFGSTRIKAVLIDEHHTVLASGSHGWENLYENGIWTYSMKDVWAGLQDCYRDLASNIRRTYGITLTTVGSIGFSGMMHGYLPFDIDGNLLAPFRTWRNTMTEQAAQELTELFAFNIPMRWSVAYLWQAILNGESHVDKICFITTLAGYVHWKLTGEKVVGVGEASGMFPIDSTTGGFHAHMVAQFDKLLANKHMPWRFGDIMPMVLPAGAHGGYLTEEGARIFDPTGNLRGGIPVCPPEGDADTGMVATDSIAVRTGNVSAGTSSFAMIVLESELTDYHTEIDMVATPSGKPVAMVHTNTCTTDIDAWVKLFQEVTEAFGVKVDTAKLYNTLYKEALIGDSDCGGMLAYNYYSGEPVTETAGGRPLFVREPDSRFTLANFMRTHLFSALATLRIGMDILFEKEHVKVDVLSGHGGFFKTEEVGQRLMAASMETSVSVMETAGEGGAWGMAILAAYMLRRKEEDTLEEYIRNRVFANVKKSVLKPFDVDVQSFRNFLARYKKGLPIERSAVDFMS